VTKSEGKTCTGCNKWQPFTEYRSRGGKQSHLLQSRCKRCQYEMHKEYVDNNPERVRKYRAKDKWTLKKRCARHNITIEEFWTLYEEQDGTCPVCDKAVSPDDSAIDHNHDTGDVRGIIHKTCNRALGMLGDSPDTLERAAEYLRQRGFYGDGE
jgi:hypothetical protein